jgi:hypothetical protein
VEEGCLLTLILAILANLKMDENIEIMNEKSPKFIDVINSDFIFFYMF